MIVKGRRNIKTGGCKAINYTSSKVITETGIFWIMQTLSLFFSRQEYKYQHHKYKTQTFSNGWKLGHSCDLSNIDGTNVLVAQRCFINMIWRIYNCAKNWVRNIYGKYHKYYVCCHWSLRPTVGVDVLKTKVRQLKFCLTDFSAALLTYFHVCLFLFHWVGKDHPTDVFSPPLSASSTKNRRFPLLWLKRRWSCFCQQSLFVGRWNLCVLRFLVLNRDTWALSWRWKNCHLISIDPYQQNISWRRKNCRLILFPK